MKQKKSDALAYAYLFYYQPQFDKDGVICAYDRIVGLGTETFHSNGIALKIQQNHKTLSNTLMLMKKRKLTREETQDLVQQFDISEELAMTYIYDRPDEFLEQIDIFKHITKKDLYLAVLAQRTLVIFERSDSGQQEEKKYTLDEAKSIIKEHLEFLGFTEDRVAQESRILFHNRDLLSQELPELKLPEVGRGANESLLKVPTYKIDGTFDWASLTEIPKSLLQ